MTLGSTYAEFLAGAHFLLVFSASLNLLNVFSDSDTFISYCVFSFIKFRLEVNVTTIFYPRIKHDLFPFLCIGENHGNILKLIITLMCF